MTKIKICGITNMEDAMAAVKLGADTFQCVAAFRLVPVRLGFVFLATQNIVLQFADAKKNGKTPATL